MYFSLICRSLLVTTNCVPALSQSSYSPTFFILTRFTSFVAATRNNLFDKNRSAIAIIRNSGHRYSSAFRHQPNIDAVLTQNLILRSPRNLSSMASLSNPKKCLVAVCQLTSKEDKEQNFKDASSIVREAAAAKCKLIFLPECFDMLCESRARTMEQCEPINGLLIKRYQTLAKELNVFLFLGGLHERNEANPGGKSSNSHIAINDQGEIISIYRKLHLFNLDVPGTRLLESEFSVPGDRVEPPVDTPAGKVGLGICYDVRFPEFAISLAKAGASIITYPSSFTVKTGLAHWETLLRARAIETQCYVIAAAQNGIHNPKRSSYGHAMIVDPWGHVVAQCTDQNGFAMTYIDQDYLIEVRRRLPVWNDRKPQAYGEIRPAGYSPSLNSYPIDGQSEYQFGKAIIHPDQVFLRTRHSYAFCNHLPILQGHVLVASLSPVQKFTQLNPEEVADLFQTVQRVQRAIECELDTNAFNIALQDGFDAGQSIEHVHVHLVPRKPGDFGGQVDQVYTELSQHDKCHTSVRSQEEMREEALRLRKYFVINA